MEIDILSPQEQVFSGTIFQVTLPGVQGYFEILDNHAPIVSVLQKGTISLIDNTGVFHQFEVSSGIVESSQHKVIVLLD